MTLADDPGVRELVERGHRALRDDGTTVATAESLTGGLLGAVLTDVSGASEVYGGGLVVYTVAGKTGVLGVPADLLDRHGPVHEATARAMAERVRDVFAATYGLATTGVAGPRAHGDQPVGTVYVACSGPGGSQVELHRLPGDRAAIRLGAVRTALDLLLRTVR